VGVDGWMVVEYYVLGVVLYNCTGVYQSVENGGTSFADPLANHCGEKGYVCRFCMDIRPGSHIFD